MQLQKSRSLGLPHGQKAAIQLKVYVYEIGAKLMQQEGEEVHKLELQAGL